jgi:hypothetical protein
LLIVSLVFGLLLESVTTNLSDIGRARLEARATQLAEQRARELEEELSLGTAIEIGVSDGEYEEPNDDLRWQIAVSEHSLDLPADYPDKAPPSPLFARPGAARSPSAPGAPDQAPPLRLIEIRVFPAEADPESAEPFVLLLTAPPDPARLQQLQQAQQNVPAKVNGATNGAPP